MSINHTNSRTESRLATFHDLENHAWYGRIYKRLKQYELQWCEHYIIDNEELDTDAFVQKVQRRAAIKGSKNDAVINELLLVVGTTEKGGRK